jgi:hypothetical protein
MTPAAPAPVTSTKLAQYRRRLEAGSSHRRGRNLLKIIDLSSSHRLGPGYLGLARSLEGTAAGSLMLRLRACRPRLTVMRPPNKHKILIQIRVTVYAQA